MRRGRLRPELPGVTVVDADLGRSDTLVAALADVDRALLISTSNAEMATVQNGFIDAAARAGVAHLDTLDLAEVAADVLTQPGHAGKVYPITGPGSLTMTEVAGILSGVTGKEIRYIDVPPEQARAAHLAAGIPPYLADGLFELFAERRKGNEATVYPVIREVFGREPRSFESFARRHAAVFRGEHPPPAN